MSIHLCVNDRFIELFLQNLKEQGKLGDNYFIVYGEDNIPFTRKDFQSCLFVNRLVDTSKTTFLVQNAPVIYIHFLSDEVIDFLSGIELSGKKVVWVFWGADGFSMKALKWRFMFPYFSISVYYNAFKQLILIKNNSKKQSFVKKHIDHFAHYIWEDFLLFRKLLKPHSRFVDFSYGCYDQLVTGVDLRGADVLIGNSGDPRNFHSYIMSNLLPRGLEAKLHCPLSYGGPSKYSSEILTLGKSLFGDNFHGYVDVLTPSQYYNQVLSVSAYAIMWHNVSQGWGNIMQLLSQGSKVFMNPDSSLCRYLIRSGFFVFPVTKRLSFGDFEPLEDQCKLHNRRLLYELFGPSRVQKSYSELMSL